jgi:KaiC/GvpD/RAD55 family RecA-like ATPase
LEVVKMRGTDHSKKLAPMKITKEGILLYPDQPFFSKGF